MIICGLKLTHDGAIALLDGNELKFCIELEKLTNNDRYASMEDTQIIETVLNAHGYSLNDVEKFAVDGWGGYDQDALAIQPRLTIGEKHNWLKVRSSNVEYELPIAQYAERNATSNIIERLKFDGLRINGSQFSYESYLHVAGHVSSAYCSSPFASSGESAYVLIWDGGMYPNLYFYNTVKKEVENLGPLFLLIGNIYTIFSQHFGPFKVKGGFAKDELSIAGKVMAYIALGNVVEKMFKTFDEIYQSCYDHPMGFANTFANEFKKRSIDWGYRDEDVLRTLHAWIEKMLVEKLEKKVRRHGVRSKNLCIAGGCGLNIKWNGTIRSMGVFDSVYVPPFPNDSGSALGAACAAMVNAGQHIDLRWSVYAGPGIIHNNAAEGWQKSDCSLAELAVLLHESSEPVVFLNGKAELGPRALGNRSILAAPVSPSMKSLLNKIKKREDYRPVSPVCMENYAAEIFKPGTPDPYMLFDHHVRPEWVEKIPAICHLDGTARLQTVNRVQNSDLFSLLEHYHEISGIPLLCNTSANHLGKGFFPDVFSATQWSGTRYVWCENKLYTLNK